MIGRFKLILANVIAFWVHRKDRYGKHRYYSYHLIGVDRMLKSNLHRFGIKEGSNIYWQLRVIAVLHDAVEDHDLSLRLIQRIFGFEVAAALDAISKRKGETREEYITRVQSNRLACVVKYYDSLFNFMSCRDDKDGERSLLYYKQAEQCVAKANEFFGILS